VRVSNRLRANFVVQVRAINAINNVPFRWFMACAVQVGHAALAPGASINPPTPVIDRHGKLATGSRCRVHIRLKLDPEVPAPAVNAGRAEADLATLATGFFATCGRGWQVDSLSPGPTPPAGIRWDPLCC